MRNPDASSPADPQVLTLFQEELARASLLPGSATTGPAVWPRFAGYYQGLTRLPRRLRRALQRRWRRSLGGIALLCALGQAPALAATIFVDGATCTLVDAITAANSDAPIGGCTAGSGADRIGLPPEETQTLTTVNNVTNGVPNGLPVITSEITISDFFSIMTTSAATAPAKRMATEAATTITRDSSAPEFRILAVSTTGNLTLDRITVNGGKFFSDVGGIANYGTLTLTKSNVSGNTGGSIGGILHAYSASGTLTLTDSTVSGNTGDFTGGIAHDSGKATLTNSTVSGNSAIFDGGISSCGDTLTLTNSTVSGNIGTGIGNCRGVLTISNSTVKGNSGQFYGSRFIGSGIENHYGTTILNSSIVSGNSADEGGGIQNRGGTLTLSNSTVEGNSAQTRGGGINNVAVVDPDYGTSHANLTLTNSTVSGNIAGISGGGVSNRDLLSVSNSTVSGNSASDRGGGMDNAGTMTFSSSTVTGNASGRVAGGLFNTGTVTLVQSLLSGNTAPVIGPEAYSVSGNVIGDGFNVFGHDSFSGVAGFTLGATDLVPTAPLSAVLDRTLSYNGGPTRTHGLVFGSPAVDAVPGAACATGTDQRGAPRPQDADGDTLADCDSGAVERGLIPIQAAITNTTLDCNGTACRVSVKCNLQETECTNPIDIAVRTRALRASDGTVVKAPKLIRFAAGTSNVPPGGTQQLRVKLTKPGKRLVRATKKRRLKGVLGIQEIATTVGSTPVTISRTDVTIKLKRRK